MTVTQNGTVPSAATGNGHAGVNGNGTAYRTVHNQAAAEEYPTVTQPLNAPLLWRMLEIKRLTYPDAAERSENIETLVATAKKKHAECLKQHLLQILSFFPEEDPGCKAMYRNKSIEPECANSLIVHFSRNFGPARADRLHEDATLLLHYADLLEGTPTPGLFQMDLRLEKLCNLIITRTDTEQHQQKVTQLIEYYNSISVTHTPDAEEDTRNLLQLTPEQYGRELQQSYRNGFRQGRASRNDISADLVTGLALAAVAYGYLAFRHQVPSTETTIMATTAFVMGTFSRHAWPIVTESARQLLSHGLERLQNGQGR